MKTDTEFDIKYLQNGQEVHLISKLPDGKFYVGILFEDDQTDEFYVGTETIVDKIFDEIPIQKYSEEVQKLQEEISELRKEKQALHFDISDAKAVNKEIFEKFKKFKGLELLEDFIEGKISHYVEINYGTPKIIPFDETNCDSSYYRRDCFRLLSLFGRSDGDLEWRLSQYSDGSGCGSTVYPCTSYDQAIDIVREWFAEKAKTDLENIDKDRGNKPSLSIIEKAKEYAITMPDEYIKSAHEIDKKLRANKIKKLQEEINALIAKETEVEEDLF